MYSLLHVLCHAYHYLCTVSSEQVFLAFTSLVKICSPPGGKKSGHAGYEPKLSYIIILLQLVLCHDIIICAVSKEHVFCHS